MKMKSQAKLSFVFHLLVLSLFSALQTTAFAQSSSGRAEVFPRMEPDPMALNFYNEGRRGYSWTDLAEISLWASGASSLNAAAPADASYLERIIKIAEAVNTSAQLPKADRDKAEFILDYMHKNILKYYSTNQTRIDTMLTGSRYNCVSSAVLYMILCKSAALDVAGVATRDHAFVSVHINGEDIDVETTNPYGFDPGNRREFHDQFGRLTGFAYVPARNYRDRQMISPMELISLIIRNRISELESTNRFAEAIPLAIDRAALLNGSTLTGSGGGDLSDTLFEDPYKTLLDRIFNYGAFLLRSGKEEECLRWAGFASPLYPDENRWPEFVLAAVNNRLTKYVQANQITEARDFLKNHGHFLTPADYTRFDHMLIDTGLANSASRIRDAEDSYNLVAAIEEARKNQTISDKRANELFTYAIQRTASILSSGRDWLAAINYIENAVARFGSNSELEQSLQIYRNNRASDFHNRFATAWNRGNYDEAGRILNEGLSEFPNNRLLLADRETLNKNRQ